LSARIDPAGVNAIADALRDLIVNLAAKARQATERRLDVTAGTAKSVVKIEVTKRGVEIVEPHQAHHATAKPDAFRISGWAIDGLRRFDEFVGLALIVLGCVGRGGRICRRWFAGLVLRPSVAALGKRASNTDQQCQGGDGQLAQNRKFELKHPSTHKFPEFVACPQPARAGLVPSKLVSNAAETPRDSMTDISDFVQQSHNFITLWGSGRAGTPSIARIPHLADGR
jgi:hypothetical protein